MRSFGKICLIASLSLFFTGGVLLAQQTPATPEPAPAAIAPAAPAADAGDPAGLEGMNAMIDKALTAYNSGDFKTFYGDFAKSMAAVATEQAFKTLYVDMYMKTYGKYQSRTMIKEQSVLIPENPMPLAVFEAVFEKNAKVKLSVNFTKEDGALKVMQIQFNPM